MFVFVRASFVQHRRGCTTDPSEKRAGDGAPFPHGRIALFLRGARPACFWRGGHDGRTRFSKCEWAQRVPLFRFFLVIFNCFGVSMPVTFIFLFQIDPSSTSQLKKSPFPSADIKINVYNEIAGVSDIPTHGFLCRWRNWPSRTRAGVRSSGHANGWGHFTGVHGGVWALFGAGRDATAIVAAPLDFGHDAGGARGLFEEKAEIAEARLPGAASAAVATSAPTGKLWPEQQQQEGRQ